jgi:L-threonate 2-dehydrogenase
MKIGLIGVGAMGLAMAQRLRDGGHAVVVRDIDPAREALARAARCTVAASPAALAGEVELLIIAVVDGAQTHAVLFGADGAARTLRRGSTVLLCPTIAPADVEAAAAQLAELGVDALDAPMSGGPQRAREGQMSLMVAGSEAAFERCLPLLRELSSHLFCIGPRAGDGARTKLVNNLLAAINLAGAAEALALAQRLGLNAATTLGVIEQSSGQSWIGSDRAHRWLASDHAVRARVALLAKDSALALAEAGGATYPLGAAAATAFAQALAAGLADADDAALIAQALARPAAWAVAPQPAAPAAGAAESAP